MLGYFLESADVGIYSVAVRIAGMAVFLLSATNTIFGPTISELTEKKQINNLKRLLKSITKIIFTFSLNFLLFVIVFNKEILTIFGEEYISGGIVLMILTFGQFINASAGSTGMVLVMSGNQKYEVYNSIGICILNIILNIFLIPIYGIEGAAIATATSIIFINIIKVIEVYEIFGIHPYKKSFIKIFIFAFIKIGFLALFKFININYIIKLIIVIFSSIVVNFILIFKFALEKDDNFIFDKIIKKLKS
jgi:O-antigen/teichoic acid export membrane protein